MHLLSESLGYIAILAGFYAVTKKEMSGFRLWHLVSNCFYVGYGLLLSSGPLVISGIFFVIVHAYHLRRGRRTPAV